MASAALLAACSRDDARCNAPNAHPGGDGATTETTRVEQANLLAACEQSAEYWRRQLGAGGRAMVRPPFVLAGTLPEHELRAWYTHSIRPAALAMREKYFRHAPDRPVAILMFHDEATYRGEAERLFGDRAVSRHGYYRPHLRTLVVNAASGRSALLHELTHALMALDFPEAPAWLREGLAALHEDCRFEGEPPRIVPLAGARQTTFHRALAKGRLPSLKWLLRAASFDGPEQSLAYALARHFCLFLDQRGVLDLVYRAVREQGGATDSTAILLSALELHSSDALETEFHRWAK